MLSYVPIMKISDKTADLLSGIFMLIVAIAILFLCISCGTTKAVVRASADNVTSEIRITTNNSNSVIISPKVIIDTLNKN